MKQTEEQRFWKFVQKGSDEECWLWLGCRTAPESYGRFQRGVKSPITAHRMSYLLTYGYMPNVCRHTCDNKPCVNPKHLLDGTVKDNARDAVERNRYKCGEHHVHARFSNEQALHIRQLYKTGQYSHLKLARRFGVAESTIWWLLNGYTYKEAV